jgi:hypothetical protein
MERGYLLSDFIGMSGKNPYPFWTFLELIPEVLESAREAVYK